MGWPFWATHLPPKIFGTLIGSDIVRTPRGRPLTLARGQQRRPVEWLDLVPDVPAVVYTRGHVEPGQPNFVYLPGGCLPPPPATLNPSTVVPGIHCVRFAQLHGSQTLPPSSGAQGYEAAAYVRFILDCWDRLPAATAFLHDHRSSWHSSDMVLRRLPLMSTPRIYIFYPLGMLKQPVLRPLGPLDTAGADTLLRVVD